MAAQLPLVNWFAGCKSCSKVEHHGGLKHTSADALSRRPCLDSDCKHCGRQDAKEPKSSFKEKKWIRVSVSLANLQVLMKRLMLSPGDEVPRSWGKPRWATRILVLCYDGRRRTDHPGRKWRLMVRRRRPTGLSGKAWLCTIEYFTACWKPQLVITQSS